MNVAIYSALYGPYEHVKPIPDLGVPAYMFTDMKGLYLANMGWVSVYVEPHPADSETWTDPSATVNMMRHKWWKTHPHHLGDFDATIWMDASITVDVPNFVELCLGALGGDDWACVPHPSRNCIYTEADFSAQLSRYDAASLQKQAEWYRQIGHPANHGLIATGLNIRRHSETVVKVCENWWQENVNWSHQDQVSLPVLFRLQEDLKWNTNLPWGQWWTTHPHGR